MVSRDPSSEIRNMLESQIEAADQQMARYESYAWTIHTCKDAVEAIREKLAQALSRIEEVDQVHGSTNLFSEPPWHDLHDE